jgi:DNA invertase Pin-like site-specific DNA recombinase
MNVVLYTRVSTNKREQKPEVQAQELKRYCKARGFLIAHEIMDRASGGTDDRPGLKRLLQLVHRGHEGAAVGALRGHRPQEPV